MALSPSDFVQILTVAQVWDFQGLTRVRFNRHESPDAADSAWHINNKLSGISSQIWMIILKCGMRPQWERSVDSIQYCRGRTCRCVTWFWVQSQWADDTASVAAVRAGWLLQQRLAPGRPSTESLIQLHRRCGCMSYITDVALIKNHSSNASLNSNNKTS